LHKIFSIPELRSCFKITLILIGRRNAQKNLRATMASFCKSVCGMLGQM